MPHITVSSDSDELLRNFKLERSQKAAAPISRPVGPIGTQPTGPPREGRGDAIPMPLRALRLTGQSLPGFQGELEQLLKLRGEGGVNPNFKLGNIGPFRSPPGGRMDRFFGGGGTQTQLGGGQEALAGAAGGRPRLHLYRASPAG